MKLQLADELALPTEAATEVLAFLGRRGQGKSYAAQRLAELFYEASAQFVVLDQVGIWWGLRLAANGKDPGIPIPVLGGLHGDMPLEATAGKLIADLVADRWISVVLDVSQFESDAARGRFTHDFVDRFFYRLKAAPRAVHTFVEECQECVPQNPANKPETDMLHVLQRAVKLGRNYGMGFSLISQRPQEVHKKVLNLAELLFAFQLTGKHERRAVAEWIQDKAIDEDIEQELPRLERGHPHAWSPAWLKVSRVVHITPRWTFDASATPKVGIGQKARELGPIDLKDLEAKMAATVERAKAEDPRELRRRIAELERERKDLVKPTPAPPAKVERVEIPVIRGPELAKITKLAEKLAAAGDVLAAVAQQLEDESRQVLAAIAKAAAAPDRTTPHQNAPRVGPGAPPMPLRRTGPLPLPRAARAPIPSGLDRHHRSRGSSTADISEPITGPQQRILDAAAFLESLGIAQPDIVQLALFAGLSATGGYWRASIGRLRTLGLIDGVQLTEAGRARAEPSAITTVEQLHEHVFTNLLEGAQKQILRVLIDAYPEGLSAAECGARAGLEPNGGYWRACVGRLRSLGVITKRGPLAALPVLFLEGGAR